MPFPLPFTWGDLNSEKGWPPPLRRPPSFSLRWQAEASQVCGEGGGGEVGERAGEEEGQRGRTPPRPQPPAINLGEQAVGHMGHHQAIGGSIKDDSNDSGIALNLSRKRLPLGCKCHSRKRRQVEKGGGGYSYLSQPPPLANLLPPLPTRLASLPPPYPRARLASAHRPPPFTLSGPLCMLVRGEREVPLFFIFCLTYIYAPHFLF